MDNYKAHEFAQLIGVSVRTLRRWNSKGVFCAYRTPTGRPFYTNEHYMQYIIQTNLVLTKHESSAEHTQSPCLESGLQKQLDKQVDF